MVVLTACGAGSTAAGPSASASAPAVVTTTTATGVRVSGAFGSAPTVTVPATAAPGDLTQQTLIQGSGATVSKGDTLIVDYVGQTWAPKNGTVNVFDSSYSRGVPNAFVIGEGAVIAGWDAALVGKQVGSRVLLTVPPVDGYGSAGQAAAKISGTDTLVFVIDLVSTYKPDASAPGTAVTDLPTTGLPRVTNPVGKQPSVVSTAGVPIPVAPESTLLVAGSGAKIDSAKTLVVQLVQTDLATGKDTQSTWGQAPQTDAASTVLGIANKLTGQNIGSRVLVLLPATAAVPATATSAAEPAAPPEVLIIDVVGQF
jgi:peptidylprolyl isomerase